MDQQFQLQDVAEGNFTLDFLSLSCLWFGVIISTSGFFKCLEFAHLYLPSITIIKWARFPQARVFVIKSLCNSSSLRFIGVSCAGKHGLCQAVGNICEHQRNFIIMKHAVAVLPNHLSVVEGVNRKYNRLLILPLIGSGSGDKIVLGIYRMHIFTRHFRSVSIVCPVNPGSHIRFLFKDRVHCVAFFFPLNQG